MQAAWAGIKLRYFAIALLPVCVFLINAWLLREYGEPLDVPPPRLAEFDVYKEGAARVTAAATFLLFVGTAGAALLMFADTLRMLSRPDRLLALGAFALLAGSPFAVQPEEPRYAELYPGQTVFCVAAAYSKAESDEARRLEKANLESVARARAPQRQAGAAPNSMPAVGTAGPGPVTLGPGVSLRHLPSAANCEASTLAKPARLARLQFLLIVLSFAGLVIGGICCTAGPAALRREDAAHEPALDPAVPPLDGAAPEPPPGEDRQAPHSDLAHWEAQAARLNTFLYLGALMLGTALLFLGAFLRWPAFVLQSTQTYDNYVAGLLTYYGFTFTLMLAAFYIPLAAILARKGLNCTAARTGLAKLPEAFTGPLQLLKIILGLGSTALAGMLPGIIDLIS